MHMDNGTSRRKFVQQFSLAISSVPLMSKISLDSGQTAITRKDMEATRPQPGDNTSDIMSIN